jgi:hypothetical protein
MLPDALQRLDYASLVERVTCHFKRDLLGVHIVHASDGGTGCWEFAIRMDKIAKIASGERGSEWCD